MEWATKMYSPKRYLKDVVEKYGDKVLPVNVYSISAGDFDQNAITILRNIALEYWHFAEIGFDFDDIFIQRFNAVWAETLPKYLSIVKNTVSSTINGYKLTKERSENSKRTPNLNTQTTTTDSGTDTFHRQQDDTALQRASQNSSIKSILDNTTNYGKTRDNLVTEEGTDETENTFKSTDVNQFYDSEKLMNYMKETSIYKSFVLEFSNCFMEVL